MRLTNLTFFAIFILFVFFSCSTKNNSSSNSAKPKAKGAPGEIVMVIDSATYQGIVGDEIRATFQSQVEFLPRPESYFTVRVVQPDELNDVLRTAKNLIYVTVLNDKGRGNRLLKSNFTKETIAAVEKDPSIFRFSKQDEFARGQEVLHLFSTDKETLAKNIAENKEELRDYFDNLENERLSKKLFSTEEKGIENFIKENYECEIKLPTGFEIAINEDNFIWTRILDPVVDKDIFITYTDYTSQNQFSKEALINFRDSVAHQHIFGDPENENSYMVTEVENFPVFYKEVNFNGKYAVQLRGMWKTHNFSMGGPFVSYALVDENTRRFYYIEGFLYSPGRKQREYMRELDVILRSFEPVNNTKS